MNSTDRGHNLLRHHELSTMLRRIGNAALPPIRTENAGHPTLLRHPTRPAPSSVTSPSGTHFPMLIGFVMVFALLAVGFGYVVFANTATGGGIFWDLGFLAFAVAFLATFVAVIWSHASTQFSHDSDRETPNDRQSGPTPRN